MANRTYECQHPLKGQAARYKRADLPDKAKPVAAWFKSISGEWMLQEVVDQKDHPAWKDFYYTFTTATEVVK